MRTPSQDNRAVPSGVARNTQNGPLGSEPTFETADDYAFATLCFTTVMGLVAIVAAMFTTMLPLPDAWRYFWLATCVVTFALTLIGIVLFFRRKTSERK
jgi:hypothetical protein